MRLAPFTRALLVFAGLNLALSLALGDLHSLRFLGFTRSYIGNDLASLYDALRVAEPFHAPPLYERVFFGERIKFQYPSTSLLFFAPFRDLPWRWFRLLFESIVNRIWLLLSIGVLFALFERLVVSADHPPRERWLLRIAFLVLLFSFYPFFKAFTLGQVQVWINCLLILSIGAWLRGSERFAGALLGVATLIKPNYGLLLAWGLLRRRLGFVAALAIVAAAGMLAAAAVFGVDNLLGYREVIAFMSRHGEGYYPNQSVNGLMNRLLVNGNNLDWVDHGFPPFNGLVYGVTVAGGQLLLGTALFAAGRRSPARGTVEDLSIMLLSVTLASPIAWEHHYGFVIALYLVATHRILGLADPWRTRLLALTAASFLLTAHFVHAVDVWFAPTRLNVLQSYLFAGALALLLVLHVALRRLPPPAAAAPAG